MKKEMLPEEGITIDVMHLLRYLWKKAWIIVLSGLLAATIGLLYSMFMLSPQYSSDVRLYVNLESQGQGGNLSQSNLTLAKSLVKTYGTILEGRTTLQRVIDETGVNYTWKELKGMIAYAPSNDTEIMKITVTCGDPYEACNIANAIADILPRRVEEIVEGSAVKIVDEAVPNLNKVSPSISKYTILGLLVGAVLAIAVIALFAILDDRIHDEDFVLQNYDYPVLGKVPDLSSADSNGYGYYQRPNNFDAERNG